MYEPLEFMEQCEHMIEVTNARHLSDVYSKRNLEYFELADKSMESGGLLAFTIAWSKYRGKDIGEEDRVFIQAMKRAYKQHMNLVSGSDEDFCHTAILSFIHNRWVRAKRVYKVEPEMCEDFCSMNVPNKLESTVITHLPSDSFYVELGENSIISNCKGFFVNHDCSSGMHILVLTALVRNGKLSPVHCLLVINEGTEENLVESCQLYPKSSDVKLENGGYAQVRERDWVHFFINFCLYLRAANNDVEYTERTKSIYRKPAPNAEPKNKMREVEEFGVGYRYSTVVSKSKPKVKYVGGGPDDVGEPREKRKYSSNYRSAHWHHFWINDPDVPGQKKLILHWLKEQYVRGNNSVSTKVTIHKVTK